jgi:membrane protease YdiL (CAAX protease family)
MDVEQKPEPVPIEVSLADPVRKPSGWFTFLQVLITCGQIPTQTFIAFLLLAAGISYDGKNGLNLTFVAALTLTDTIDLITLMRWFLIDSGESPMRVFFGEREREHGLYNLSRETTIGLVSIPVVLIGALGLAALLKIYVPILHNVAVSPFEPFFDTPGHALLFTFVAMVAGGVREELQRGFLLHRFGQSLGGEKLGLAIYSDAFGAAHATQGWDAAIATGLLGLFWGILYIKRRSVAAAMVSHAGFNGTQVLQQLLVKTLTR